MYTIANNNIATIQGSYATTDAWATGPIRDQQIHISDEYKDSVYLNNTKVSLVPPVTKVIFNDPATIVYFEDGTKTIVKRMEDQEYNPEIGFLLCIMKRVYGDDYHKLMWKHCWGGQEARRTHRKKYKMANKAKDETK